MRTIPTDAEDAKITTAILRALTENPSDGPAPTLAQAIRWELEVSSEDLNELYAAIPDVWARMAAPHRAHRILGRQSMDGWQHVWCDDCGAELLVSGVIRDAEPPRAPRHRA